MIEDACRKYEELLKTELILSQGCTEPAAIAYVSAVCRQNMERFPERVVISCSGNLFKNAKSVMIPNTDGLKGIAAACVCGFVSPEAELKLEILRSVTAERLQRVHELLDTPFCEVKLLQSPEKLHIIAEGFAGEEHVLAELTHDHTHIRKIERNGEILYSDDTASAGGSTEELYAALNPADIVAFAETADLSGDLGDLLRLQVKCNVAICREGMTNDWGSCVGKLTKGESDDVEKLACAFGAAGSDARMSGCAMPVVINSGSGNQGITVTAPVYVYAKYLGADEDRMLRGLLVSNLMSLYQKRLIGKLSAYCGAVTAGCAAGAAICWLRGGNAQQVERAFTNASASISGMFCDGAKPSCAAKIATSVFMGILGQKMALTGHDLLAGDGIVGSTPKDTVESVGRLAREGLTDIDNLILEIMYSTLPC